MIRRFILTIICCCLSCGAAHTQGRLGYPDRSSNDNVLEGFQNPPKGYGQVPFYWWVGDTLTREHLANHLDKLAGRGISSLQINYCHSDKGGAFWGLTYPSQPAIFTEEWWELFGWFMEEAKKRDMTVSLSDYTLGVGQGACMDKAVEENPDLRGTELIKQQIKFSGALDVQFEEIPLLVTVYKLNAAGRPIPESKKDITALISGGTLKWQAPDNSDRMALAIIPRRKNISYDPLNPLSGASYVKHFFQQFEDRFPETSKGGLNFFFSDELEFNLKGNIWNRNFASEFIRRKGYDIVPYLSALYVDEGDRTPKIRMDYNDVVVSLSEEYYFKPIYNWHDERGLIYGCDHGGRGKKVLDFGDYFRTQKWNQGPGSDQPRLGKDVIKAKVAASISHMYERPRTWLEGFYSSGWGTSSAELTDAIFANFAMGFNLMSLHGLYYSTVGGWWEWAPPCNHFHMPYWDEMKPLLKCVERMSYLFSQGYHRADVAVLYPVEPVVAGYGNKAPEKAFEIATRLYLDGLDIDFMDYESVARAKVNKNLLEVSGERFRVLVIPEMKAIRHSTLEKALEFKKAGGIVIFSGALPEASELEGRSAEVSELVAEILKQSRRDKGVAVHLDNEDEIFKYIDAAFTRDFKVVSSPEIIEAQYVMHRQMGGNDLYAVYDVPKGSECFFRAKGSAELWDPWTGNTTPLKASRVTKEGTYITMPLGGKEMQIIVFNPRGKADIESPNTATTLTINRIALSDKWEFEIIPVLDNTFGDYHWPGTPEKIGAEARELSYYQTSSLAIYYSPAFDDSSWDTVRVGFAPMFQLAEGIKNPLSMRELGELVNKPEAWKPYHMSWRWGVLNDYGHQGYHGLKAEMYDDFIRLGKIQVTGTEMKRVANPEGNNYYLLSYVYAPYDGVYSIECGSTKPAYLVLNDELFEEIPKSVTLKKGANKLLLYYDRHCTTFFVFRDDTKAGDFVEGIESYKPLSMKWNGDMSVLPFNTSDKAEEEYGWYRFTSAPGLESLSFDAYGEDVSVWTDGDPCEIIPVNRREDGLVSYSVKTGNDERKPVKVAIRIKNGSDMFYAGAAIPNPIKQYCGTGEITIGNWSEIDGLKCYSGGAIYRQIVNIPEAYAGKRISLDLGEVVSTARLYVNGKEVGLKLTPDWFFDITDFVVLGSNVVEVKVFNTAANHYNTIPTRYNGDTRSGILGPITLLAE